MARKKVAPEEKIVNAVGEETALGSVPADTAPPDETGADSGDFPAELPEGDLPAEETAEQSETLPAMEAAEAKPLGLSTEEKLHPKTKAIPQRRERKKRSCTKRCRNFRIQRRI